MSINRRKGINEEAEATIIDWVVREQRCEERNMDLEAALREWVRKHAGVMEFGRCVCSTTQLADAAAFALKHRQCLCP
jgi:hypothetical protein